MNELLQKEALLAEIIKGDDKEATVNLLFELIVDYAKEKNFVKAEAFKEKLYEVDSMALTEIVKAGEIIEAAQSESINPNHRDTWSTLYDLLTNEETNTLYYAMVEHNYDTDQYVYKEGDRPAGLYFVNQGKLKIIYEQGGKEFLLRLLGPGNLVGNDSFFSNSIYSTSVVALSSAKVGVLEKETFKKWHKQMPGLESKLQNYCLTLDKIADILKKKGLERRKRTRSKISGKCVIQLLNSAGALTGKPIRGELSDISTGGISFLIRVSKRETVRLLLGRSLVVQLKSPSNDSEFKLTRKGTIVAASLCPFDDYFFHVKYDKELSELAVEQVKERFVD